MDDKNIKELGDMPLTYFQSSVFPSLNGEFDFTNLNGAFPIYEKKTTPSIPLELPIHAVKMKDIKFFSENFPWMTDIDKLEIASMYGDIHLDDLPKVTGISNSVLSIDTNLDPQCIQDEELNKILTFKTNYPNAQFFDVNGKPITDLINGSGR